MEVTIVAGRGKDGRKEDFGHLTLRSGEIVAIVGNTGSGKSRLMKDLEQLVQGDSVTGRRILLDGSAAAQEERQRIADSLIAHLGQNMRFVLDTSVSDFIRLHSQCRNRKVAIENVLDLANELTPEPIHPGQNLNLLSGGQARALMIADISLICDSPIVLIDEIENAGVDKEKAFHHLQKQDKLVLVVTHDPHTALMAQRRIVMQYGAVHAIIERTQAEQELYLQLSRTYRQHRVYQQALRKGVHLA